MPPSLAAMDADLPLILSSLARALQAGAAPGDDAVALRLLLTCAAGAQQFVETGGAARTALVARWLPWVRCPPGPAPVPEAGRLREALAQAPLDTVLWLDGEGEERGRTLPEEVAAATRALPAGYLFIPGLLVPEGPQFLYDQHGAVTVDLDLIKHRLAPGASGAGERRYRVVLPAYHDAEGALRRGYGLIEWGHEALPPLLAALLQSEPFVIDEVPAACAALLLGHAGPLSLSRAEERLLHGDLEQAEAICALRLCADARDVGALALMGRLAARLRRPQAAAGYFRRAIAAAGPDQQRVSQLALDFASYHAGPEAPAVDVGPAGPRYLLIRALEAPLAEELQHVLGGLLLAELTGRAPFVQWGAEDLFGQLFQPLQPARGADLLAPGLRWFPARRGAADAPGVGPSGLHCLDRDEDVVVLERRVLVSELLPWLPAEHPDHGRPRQAQRRLARAHLRLRPLAAAIIEEFIAAALAGGPYVAVHAPGGPPQSGSGARLAEVAERLDQELAVLPRETPVLLSACGAGTAPLAQVVERAGRRAVVEPGGAGEGGVAQALAELRALYLLAQAEVLIGDAESPLVATAAALREDAPRAARLIEVGVSPYLTRRLRDPALDTRQRDRRYRRGP